MELLNVNISTVGAVVFGFALGWAMLAIGAAVRVIAGFAFGVPRRAVENDLPL